MYTKELVRLSIGRKYCKLVVTTNMTAILEIIKVSSEGDKLGWFAVCLSCGIVHQTEGEGDRGRKNAWMEIGRHTSKGLWKHDTKAVRGDMIAVFADQGLKVEALG